MLWWDMAQVYELMLFLDGGILLAIFFLMPAKYFAKSSAICSPPYSSMLLIFSFC